MVSKQVLSAALIIVHEAPPPWSIHFRFLFRRGSKFSSSVEGPTQFLGGHGFALPVISNVRLPGCAGIVAFVQGVDNIFLLVVTSGSSIFNERDKLRTVFFSLERTKFHLDCLPPCGVHGAPNLFM
jgi:hypothetical protein